MHTARDGVCPPRSVICMWSTNGSWWMAPHSAFGERKGSVRESGNPEYKHALPVWEVLAEGVPCFRFGGNFCAYLISLSPLCLRLQTAWSWAPAAQAKISFSENSHRQEIGSSFSREEEEDGKIRIIFAECLLPVDS